MINQISFSEINKNGKDVALFNEKIDFIELLAHAYLCHYGWRLYWDIKTQGELSYIRTEGAFGADISSINKLQDLLLVNNAHTGSDNGQIICGHGENDYSEGHKIISISKHHKYKNQVALNIDLNYFGKIIKIHAMGKMKFGGIITDKINEPLIRFQAPKKWKCHYYTINGRTHVIPYSGL
jgi:hypothetical protein